MGARGLGSSKLPVEYAQIISRHGREAGEGSDEVRAGQDRGLQIQDRRVAGMCGTELKLRLRLRAQA